MENRPFFDQKPPLVAICHLQPLVYNLNMAAFT